MRPLFVTNRPNYCHRRFAESVGAKFFHVRQFLPENLPLASLMLNGIANSFSLPESDVYFSESIMDFYPVYYRNPQGKKIILIAEDTLFKLTKMTSIKRKYVLKVFRKADGFLAISGLCKRMLLRYINKPVNVVYPFPHKEFFHVKADVESKNILFIGRDDKSKGFPELVKAVKILRKKDREWKLYLVGECSRSVSAETGIFPVGFVDKMEPYFEKCAFHVHPAHFDPCPATVFETMNAGMIPVISGNIGQTEIFIKNGMGRLVLNSVNPESIARKLLDTFNRDKTAISRRARNLSLDFRERGRTASFRKEFRHLIEEVSG